MTYQPLTTDEGRAMQYHVADQIGPDQVCEVMIDYPTKVVGLENCTEFQREMHSTLEALMCKHLGERV